MTLAFAAASAVLRGMPAEFERTVESGSVTELGGVMASRAVVSGGRDDGCAA